MTIVQDRFSGGRARGEFATKGAGPHYPPDLRLEPVHLVIDLHVSIDERAVQGSVTHTVRCGSAGARRLVLDAVDLDIDAVEAVGEARLSHDYDGRELAITWAEPFAKGEERAVRIAYRVVEPVSGVLFSRPTETQPSAPRFAVTDHETERARHWLPTIDLPEVRPTLEFRLRAEAGLTVLANGERTGEVAHEGGDETVIWEQREPCPSYLTCFAIGDFVCWDDGEYRGKPVACFTTAPFTAADLERSFGKTKPMLAFLEERLGSDFPFAKYFQFAVEGIGGAMENISLVSWDDKFLLDESLESELGWLVDAINVHEMAHTWFGDHVVCRDYAHAWLKESWATYIEVCWHEHTGGADAQQYNLWMNRRRYFGEADERYQRPIVTRTFDTSWQMYDMHLYPGGALRLHLLRTELGDDVFWPAVSDYLGRYGGAVVETDDFRRLLEQHSGRSLGRFFDQWLHRPGYPKLTVKFTYDEEKGEGAFRVEQTQLDDEVGVGLFDLPLDLSWTIGDETHRKTVELRERVGRYTFEMAASPDMVRLDPDARLPHVAELDVGTGRLEAQLTGAPDIVGRIQAGYALAKSGKPAAIAAIAAAFDDEAYWGVKAEWAEALGESGSEAALLALVHIVATCDVAPALAQVMRAASEYQDSRLAEAVAARLQAGLPPRAAEAAAEALGRQREAAPLGQLVDASARATRGGFAQAGALRALGGTRRVEALETLLERSEVGAVDGRARAGAAVGLGELARVLEGRPAERAAERLMTLLRDPDRRVTLAAAEALASTGFGTAVPVLEQFARRLPAQERVAIERAAARARRDPKASVRGLEKQVDELRASLRKLQDEVRG